jgi:hypothetical protein
VLGLDRAVRLLDDELARRVRLGDAAALVHSGLLGVVVGQDTSFVLDLPLGAVRHYPVDLPVELPAEGPGPNEFAALGEVQHRLLAFQRRYEQTAVPFAWRFPRADLNRLLHRLAARSGR